MAKLTLLGMVQDILNDMDSDPANSIDDTEESLQVAQIVKTAYFKLASRRDDWPFLKTLTTLTGLGDVTNPTKMQFPTNLNKVYWIKYNKKSVQYLEPEEFKKMVDERTAQTGVVNSSGYIINADPQYWTTYDDDFVFFDGRNSAVDTTLQASKSAVYGILVPSWNHVDGFVPTLPEKMFPILLADAKGTAFLALKQQANAKEEDFARRGMARAQNTAYRNDKGEPTTNKGVSYGRK